MELYLDTSDVDAVKTLARVFPLAGVTTNPSIVARGKNRWMSYCHNCMKRWEDRGVCSLR